MKCTNLHKYVLGLASIILITVFVIGCVSTKAVYLGPVDETYALEGRLVPAHTSNTNTMPCVSRGRRDRREFLYDGPTSPNRSDLSPGLSHNHLPC